MKKCATDYAVKYVSDDALPDDVDWVYAWAEDGELILFIKCSSVTPTVLAEAWAAYRTIHEQTAQVEPVIAERKPVEPRSAVLWVLAALLLAGSLQLVLFSHNHNLAAWLGDTACVVAAFATVKHLLWRGEERLTRIITAGVPQQRAAPEREGRHLRHVS